MTTKDNLATRGESVPEWELPSSPGHICPHGLQLLAGTPITSCSRTLHRPPRHAHLSYASPSHAQASACPQLHAVAPTHYCTGCWGTGQVGENVQPQMPRRQGLGVPATLTSTEADVHDPIHIAPEPNGPHGSAYSVLTWKTYPTQPGTTGDVLAGAPTRESPFIPKC